MLKHFLILLAFSPVSAQFYNSLSNNGSTDNGKGYQYEFDGANNKNCLSFLGLRWDIQPVNWAVSINETDHCLRISNSQIDPRSYWYINNYFSDSACNRINYPNEVDFSQNLSISYLVRSNKNIENFCILPLTTYNGGDYFSVETVAVFPYFALKANEWTTVKIELCKGTPEWESKTISKRNILTSAQGFQIKIVDPILLQMDLDLKIDIDSLRFGDAATKCNPTGFNPGQLSSSSFSISPNPFQDNFSLKSDSEIRRVEILDVHQKMVKEISNLDGQKIQVEELSSGIYFLKCYGKENTIFTLKAIKK